MGRPAKFSDESILDAALELVADGGAGAATVTAVAARLGAPSGSIYHRFASRDLLVARLWMRTSGEFQEGFVRALGLADPEHAAREAMLHTVRWSRHNPVRARVLLLHRRVDLIASWPDELGQELADLNRPVGAALVGFVRLRYGRVAPELLDGARLALIDVPYAAVRTHLADGTSPPTNLDDVVAVAGSAILDHLEANGRA